MIVQNRDASRRVFVETWRKYRSKQPLAGIEHIVAGVILQHPEYQHWLEQPGIMQHDFQSVPDGDNPFLHMGLHIAVQEQISTDRPAGTLSCYHALRLKYPDEHGLQHRMMECLGHSLWQAQKRGKMPDEAEYLESLGRL